MTKKRDGKREENLYYWSSFYSATSLVISLLVDVSIKLTLHSSVHLELSEGLKVEEYTRVKSRGVHHSLRRVGDLEMLCNIIGHSMSFF